MNFKTTLVLVLTLVISIGLTLWLVLGDANDTAPADTGLFPGLAARDITQVTVQREGVTAVFQREEDGWWQVEPIRYRLRPPTAQSPGFDNRLARSLDVQTHQTLTLGQDATAEEMGLDQPVQVTFLTNAGEPYAISLGKPRMGGLAYAQVHDADEAVIITDAMHEWAAVNPLSALRETKLDLPRLYQAQAIHIERADENLSLERTGRRWGFGGQDTAGRVDTASVESVLGLVAQARVLAFVDDVPDRLSDYGLDPARVTVRFVVPQAQGGNEEAILHVGRAVDAENRAYYATWSRGETDPPVIALASDLAVAFSAPRDAWRDRDLLAIQSRHVGSIQFDPAGVTLHRDPVEPGEMETWLRALEQSQAQGFTAIPSGVEPLSVIHLIGFGANGEPGPTLQSLTVYPHTQEGFWRIVAEPETGRAALVPALPLDWPTP